jgi:hypothetical protein
LIGQLLISRTISCSGTFHQEKKKGKRFAGEEGQGTKGTLLVPYGLFDARDRIQALFFGLKIRKGTGMKRKNEE